MNDKKNYKILLIFFLQLFIIYCSNKDKEISISTEHLNLKTIYEIPQDDNYFITKPIKMLCYKCKIYILDNKFSRIMIFTENGFSHTIGNPGFGPSEFLNAISFDISDDKLFLLNQNHRIEIFNIDGEYIETIIFKSPSKYSVATDLKVHKNFIYIALSLGEVRVQIFDLKGEFIDNFVFGGRKSIPSKIIISNPLDIYILPEREELLLFNRFNGEIEKFSIKYRNLIQRIERYDKLTYERTLSLNRNLINMKSEEKEIKSIIMLRSSLDIENNILYIIPSQVSVNEHKRRKFIYLYHANSEKMTRKFIQFSGIDIIIKDCSFLNEKLIYMDYNFGLFIGG